MLHNPMAQPQGGDLIRVVPPRDSTESLLSTEEYPPPKPSMGYRTTRVVFTIRDNPLDADFIECTLRARDPRESSMQGSIFAVLTVPNAQNSANEFTIEAPLEKEFWLNCHLGRGEYLLSDTIFSTTPLRVSLSMHNPRISIVADRILKLHNPEYPDRKLYFETSLSYIQEVEGSPRRKTNL